MQNWIHQAPFIFLQGIIMNAARKHSAAIHIPVRF